MALRAVAWRKALFALLLLCATAFAQAPEFDPVEGHTHQSRHCCGLCHVGPLPALQASASELPKPLEPLSWMPSAPGVVRGCDRPLSHRSSRAPPV